MNKLFYLPEFLTKCLVHALKAWLFLDNGRELASFFWGWGCAICLVGLRIFIDSFGIKNLILFSMTLGKYLKISLFWHSQQKFWSYVSVQNYQRTLNPWPYQFLTYNEKNTFTINKFYKKDMRLASTGNPFHEAKS